VINGLKEEILKDELDLEKANIDNFP